MDKTTIQTLIDKVIGKKGLIRVPSWWMRKVLMQMADWVQEGDDANDKKIRGVKEEISTLDTNINTLETNTNSKISTLETDTNNVLFELVETAKLPLSIKCFTVKTDSSGGFVVVDGVEQIIPVNAKRVIPFVGKFRFGGLGIGYNSISFIGLTATDTSAMTDMSHMFYCCSSLTSLNLSGLDTSAVTNMYYMFNDCRSLTSLNLSGLDTSAVTNMGSMFSNCSSLTSLDLSGFATSAVKNMSHMFYSCSNLVSLNLSGFATSAVTNMKYMFINCSSLASLDLSGFDTSAVTDMSHMFSSCSNLTSLDLSGFDTSAVTDMKYMFNDCRSLTSLNLSGFDTSAVTDMNSMFYNCSSLSSLILGPNFFKTSKVTSVDFSSSTKWINDTVVTSLVTNSYDRATAGLSTMTLKLSANTKAALTDEQKAAITAKGYTIA